MMEKVRRAQSLRSSSGMHYALEVDGGITAETARVSIESGADVIVAGTAIFKTNDYATAIRALRGEAPAPATS
jgi:ribulose-phosphate 3-epimerase